MAEQHDIKKALLEVEAVMRHYNLAGAVAVACESGHGSYAVCLPPGPVTVVNNNEVAIRRDLSADDEPFVEGVLSLALMTRAVNEMATTIGRSLLSRFPKDVAVALIERHGTQHLDAIKVSGK